LVDSVPADEVTSATEPNPYLDFDLAPGDIAKLQSYGVRAKDAVDAGLTRVTSSEAAFHFNRVDTGEFEGILVPYRQLGPGISHCRVILDRPVRLKTSKGKLVPVLQPVASTNWLYYVSGTTPAALADSSVPVLLCNSEWSALAKAASVIARMARLDRRIPRNLTAVSGPRWKSSAVPKGAPARNQKGLLLRRHETLARFR